MMTTAILYRDCSFIQLFGREARNKPKRNQIRTAGKESIIEYFSGKSGNDSGYAYGSFEFEQKTGSKSYKRLAGRRNACKRGL